MQVRFQRSTTSAGMFGGKTAYQTTAMAILTPEEAEMFERHGMWSERINVFADAEGDERDMLERFTFANLRTGVQLADRDCQVPINMEQHIIDALQSAYRTAAVYDSFVKSRTHVYEVDGHNSKIIDAE